MFTGLNIYVNKNSEFAPKIAFQLPCTNKRNRPCRSWLLWSLWLTQSNRDRHTAILGSDPLKETPLYVTLHTHNTLKPMMNSLNKRLKKYWNAKPELSSFLFVAFIPALSSYSLKRRWGAAYGDDIFWGGSSDLMQLPLEQHQDLYNVLYFIYAVVVYADFRVWTSPLNDI